MPTPAYWGPSWRSPASRTSWAAPATIPSSSPGPPSLSGSLNGGGGTTAKLDYSGYTGGPITVALSSPTTGTASLISGGFSNLKSLAGSPNGGDTLTATNAVTAWAVTALNGGKAGTFAFTGIENLVGGSGADTFKISNGKGVGGSITGGSGSRNTLDYSTWTTGVAVDLGSGQASGIAQGIRGFNIVTGSKYADSLTAGSGTDIIRGNGGNDTITGGSGSDILIGGSTGTSILTSGAARSILIADKGTAGTLHGSAAGDILIGGYTSYDTYTTANNNALLALLGEWTMPTHTRPVSLRSAAALARPSSARPPSTIPPPAMCWTASPTTRPTPTGSGRPARRRSRMQTPASRSTDNHVRLGKGGRSSMPNRAAAPFVETLVGPRFGAAHGASLRAQ